METTALSAADSVTIRHLPEAETLVVTGPDRRSWLDGLVTCEVKNLEAAQGAWGLFLNRLGKIQSPFYALETGDCLLLSVSAGTVDALLPELDKMLIMEDAEVMRAPQSWHWYFVHGQQAMSLAEQLSASCSGHRAAVDPLGLGGQLLAVQQILAADTLRAHQAHLLTELEWTAIRLERNHPEFGVDYTAADRPHEAGLERKAVNWNKGCYLGQEVVCMQDMRGKVKTSSRTLAIQAPAAAPVRPGLVVCDSAGAEVGKLTSAAFSETTAQWLGMARVQLARAGGELSISLGDEQTASAAIASGPDPLPPPKQ